MNKTKFWIWLDGKIWSRKFKYSVLVWSAKTEHKIGTPRLETTKIDMNNSMERLAKCNEYDYLTLTSYFFVRVQHKSCTCMCSESCDSIGDCGERRRFTLCRAALSKTKLIRRERLTGEARLRSDHLTGSTPAGCSTWSAEPLKLLSGSHSHFRLD